MKKSDQRNLKSSMLKGNAGLLVMLILSEAPSAGHVIAAAISERSGNLLDFGEGSVYPLLHDLESKGLVDSEWQLTQAKRPSRVYRLTDAGLEELQSRLAAWNEFSTAMKLIIGGAQPHEQTS